MKLDLNFSTEEAIIISAREIYYKHGFIAEIAAINRDKLEELIHVLKPRISFERDLFRPFTGVRLDTVYFQLIMFGDAKIADNEIYFWKKNPPSFLESIESNPNFIKYKGDQ